MPTYLYCLVAPTDGPERQADAAFGIDGGRVRVLSAGTIEAWVSSVATMSPTPTAEAIVAHDAAVSAALSTGRTPLPARFGQVWSSDAECVAGIVRRTRELEPALRRIDGLVEMTVCALLATTPAPGRPGAGPGGITPGRAYLQRLRAREERERDLRAAVETLRARVGGAVGSTAHGEVADVRRSDEAFALSVSYLVERGAEADFRHAVEDVARRSGTRLVVAGPRAPYSFAPGELSTESASRTAGRSSR